MLSLIKMELEKNQMGKFVRNGFIAIGIIFLLVSGLSFGTFVEGEQPFTNFSESLMVINVFSKMVFVIFASVLLSKIIVEEFKNKTITILFTYPVSRKTIMFSKIIIVVLFTFFFILLSNVLVAVGFTTLNHFVEFVPNDYTFASLSQHFLTVLFEAVTASFFALIPLYIGMRKYSTRSTIVTSIIISSLVNSSWGDAGQQMTLSSIIAIPITLAIVGLLIGYFMMRKIENQDLYQ